MKALATVVAAAGLLMAAPAAMAQPRATPQTQPPAQQSGQQQQILERLNPKVAQQLAQQPEIQEALKNFPQDVHNTIVKAAQAQGGQLVGVSLDTHNGTTYYEAQIERNGIFYQLLVASDGKVMSWTPKTR